MIHYCTTQSYIQSKIPLWLFLSLKLFRDDQGIYGAFVCSTCPSMSSVAMLTLDQRREDIENILCLHSVAAAELTGDWRDFWGLPAIDNETLSHKFQVGLDVEVKELMEKDLFLAAVQNGGVVHLIFTLSKKNKAPFCSKCSRQKCKSFKNEQNNPDDSNENLSNHSNDSLRSGSEASEVAGPTQMPPDHYSEVEPIDEFTIQSNKDCLPIQDGS